MSEENYDSDFEYSRKVHFELIRKGQDALDEMIEVARESEHPRAYEVFSKLLRDVSDINNSLLDLNKKQKDIKQKSLPKGEKGNTTNNNLFIGTTSELQRILKGKLKQIEEVPIEIEDSNG